MSEDCDKMAALTFSPLKTGYILSKFDYSLLPSNSFRKVLILNFKNFTRSPMAMVTAIADAAIGSTPNIKMILLFQSIAASPLAVTIAVLSVFRMKFLSNSVLCGKN